MTIFPTCQTGPSGRAGQTRLTHGTISGQGGPEAWGRRAVGSGGLWGHRDAGAPGPAPALTLSASSGTRCCTRSSTYMLECDSSLRRTRSRKRAGPSDSVLCSQARWMKRERGVGAGLVQMPASLPPDACALATRPHHRDSLQAVLSPVRGQDRGCSRSPHTRALGPRGCSPPHFQPRNPAGPQRPCHMHPAPAPIPDHPSALGLLRLQGWGGPQPAAGSTPASGCAQVNADGEEDAFLPHVRVPGCPGRRHGPHSPTS